MQGKLKFFGLIIILILSGIPILAGDVPTEIPVISQRFENGEMIYDEDNGDIYVLSNISGKWWLFESGAYGDMSLNEDLDAPSERLAPENGFGRIWANDTNIRDELGWAVLPEIAFDMAIRKTDTGNLYFTRLDDVVLHLRPSGTWRALSAESEHEGQINQFTVSPEILASGEAISISYDSSGSDYVQISIMSLENPDYNTDAYIESLDASGTFEWIIPETVVGDVEISLNLINDVPSTAIGCCRETILSEAVVVNVFHTVDFSNETYAAYQEYEDGFMIWREDTGSVQIFFENSGRWQLIIEHVYKNNSGYLETAPDGCIVPNNAFGKIWYSYFDIQVDLGCAVAEEIGYTLSIDGDGLGNFEYSLPDGDTITVTGDNWE